MLIFFFSLHPKRRVCSFPTAPFSRRPAQLHGLGAAGKEGLGEGGGVQEGTSCSALVARLGKGRQRVPRHSRAADGNSEYKILPETAALLQQ